MKKKASNGWCLTLSLVKHVDFLNFKRKLGYEIATDMMIFHFIKFCSLVRR